MWAGAPAARKTPTHMPATPKPLYCYIFRRLTSGSTSGFPAIGHRWAQLMPALRQGGIAAVSEVGILGDPTTATAEEGARIFAEMVDGCLRRVTRWTPDRNGMLT